jgi:serine/threonine-protein kinase
VQINEADYLGRPVDRVAAELSAKGLKVDTQPIDNPGGKDTDTVASVSPTTGLVEGDTVTVEFYREAEPTSEPPSSEPTSEPPSSEATTPSAPASTASQATDTPSTSAQAATPSASGSPGAS